MDDGAVIKSMKERICDEEWLLNQADTYIGGVLFLLG